MQARSVKAMKMMVVLGLEGDALVEGSKQESVLKERRAVDWLEGSSSWVGIGIGFV